MPRKMTLQERRISLLRNVWLRTEIRGRPDWPTIRTITVALKGLRSKRITEKTRQKYTAQVQEAGKDLEDLARRHNSISTQISMLKTTIRKQKEQEA